MILLLLQGLTILGFLSIGGVNGQAQIDLCSYLDITTIGAQPNFMDLAPWNGIITASPNPTPSATITGKK